MKKAPSKTASRKDLELVPFDKHVTGYSKFKPDLTAKDLETLLTPIGGVFSFPFTPIETLSCTKTVGHGRTNLTIIRPTIVQVDAASPRASFDRRSTPSRNPAIQMHFEPIAYGISFAATYIMEFTVEVFGQSSFTLDGGVGAGTLGNNGNKVLNGHFKGVIDYEECTAYTTDFWISGTETRRCMGLVIHPGSFPPYSDKTVEYCGIATVGS